MYSKQTLNYLLSFIEVWYTKTVYLYIVVIW
jgi:hypothetical protein